MRRSKRRDRTADPSPSFKGADLYIMSGGGYFNLWPSKFDACIRELELAHENGCKVMLAGQSVGPFTDEQKSRLKAALRPTDVIYVRDAESAAEIEALGFEAMLAPDLALGFPCEAATDGRLVTVVPGWLSEGQDILLAGQLAEFLKGRGRGFRLRIVQTCRLWPDVLSARNLGRRLRELGVAFETALPNTYGELRAAIEGSALVASRRMHAMVIGWRSGSRVFALTKSRKIDGFLNMVGTPGNICSEDAWSGLSVGRGAAMQGESPSGGARAAVAEGVDRAFRECLERSGVAGSHDKIVQSRGN